MRATFSLCFLVIRARQKFEKKTKTKNQENRKKHMSTRHKFNSSLTHHRPKKKQKQTQPEINNQHIKQKKQPNFVQKENY